MPEMNTGDKIKELSHAISVFKFSSYDTRKSYDWLMSQTRALISLLREHNAEPGITAALADIVAHLEEQDRVQTHPLVREQILLFQQDAVVFQMIRHGFVKMEPITKTVSIK